jgi:hypothetical protein
VATDDLKILHTRDKDGVAMQQELMKVLTKQEMWELTTNETTGTMARWCTPSEMPKAREASPLPSRPNHKAAVHYGKT